MRTVDSIFQLTDDSMGQSENTALNMLREAQSDRDSLGFHFIKKRSLPLKVVASWKLSRLS